MVVVGATGGVGQILTSRLAKEGYQVKALVRNLEKAEVCALSTCLTAAGADEQRQQLLSAGHVRRRAQSRCEL